MVVQIYTVFKGAAVVLQVCTQADASAQHVHEVTVQGLHAAGLGALARGNPTMGDVELQLAAAGYTHHTGLLMVR